MLSDWLSAPTSSRLDVSIFSSMFKEHISSKAWVRLARMAVPISALLVLLPAVGSAQGGPPFRTDDPGTPGNHRWEMNYGWIGERNPSEGHYSIPNIDINYGLGEHIQLKYELPLAVHEQRGGTGDPESPSGAHINVGLGESLLGVKWRFYEHTSKPHKPDVSGSEGSETDFSISTYPQLSLDNPTNSVHRDIVGSGPQFLLPLELSARIGPLRVDGEVGYWFTNHNVPQSWIRGVLVGREFTPRTEAYVELYDEQDANRVDGAPKQREATLGVGGRHAVNRANSVLLLLMGGRSFQRVTAGSSQPSWIAYVGIQVLFGPRSANAR